MIRLSLLYPQTAESHFSMDYYINKHIPLVIAKLKHMGLRRIHIEEGVGNAIPSMPAPFAAIGYLTFTSVDDLQRGLSKHGPEIMEDIHNFTNVQPLIQISRILPKVQRSPTQGHLF
jgi:uncharacterized protein (TIGR02118 family)